MTWAYLAILAFTVVPAIVRGRDILSPARIYVSIYSLLLALYSLQLSRLQTPWSQTTTLLFWGANFLFLAGALLIWLARSIQRPGWRFDGARVRADLARDAEGLDWDWFYKVWKVSSIIFILSYAGAALIMREIPVFAHDPDQSRMRFFMASQPTNYGIFFGPLALMLSTELILFGSLARWRKIFVVAVSAFVFLLYMTIITRYDVFRFFIFAMAMYHYGRRNLGFLHIGGGTLLLFGIFMIGFFVRVNTDSISTFNEIIRIKMPRRLMWASNIYAYLANDFWNLDYAIRKYGEGQDFYPMQWGFGLFRGLLNQLRLEGPLIQSYGFDSIMNESIEKVKGLNTVVYVWPFYKDFGAAGVYFLTFAGSLAVNFFYSNAMLRPTLRGMALWALVIPAVLLSYHAALWECWFWYFNLWAIFIAHRRAAPAQAPQRHAHAGADVGLAQGV